MSILPRVVAAIAITACCVGSHASAQVTGANNPYQGLESAKGVWPPFYKPDPSDAMYTKMMADGWCKPNGKRAQAYYQSKMVDVNKLPEFSFEGKITKINAASLTAVDDKTGESFLVLVHESPTISRVTVQGKGTKEMLAAGSFVRFVGRVDPSGVAAEKIGEVELTSPVMNRAQPVEANKLQNISGKILRREGEHLVVLAPVGKIHRLEVDLKPEVEISARLSDYHYAAVGDRVKMKGRILRMTAPMPTFCFADDLDIVVAAPLGLAKSK